MLFGNFSVSYCSEVHHAKSLEALGHEVIRLQETTVPADEVLRQSLEADMLVWIHSHGFVVKGMPMIEVLERLRQKGIPSVAYHLDLYMGLERWNEYQDHEYFKVDHFFTVDKLMADWLNEHTLTKGHYIHAGVFHEEAYKLPYTIQHKHDVVFVGSRGYHKEWPYRPQLIDWLKNTYGERFAHYGGDGRGVVREAALNMLYAQSKVVVGDTLCPNFEYPYYWSDRVYETVGRGGFIIHPYIKGMESDFTDGEHLRFYQYGDFEQLKSLIDQYLADDQRRNSIRSKGQIHVAENHTYLNRWKEILERVK